MSVTPLRSVGSAAQATLRRLAAHCCHSTSAVLDVVRQRGSRAAHGAQPRRSSLRCDCPALLGSVAPSRNSLRSLRSLRSDRHAESDHEARCARGPAPCAARRLTCAPSLPGCPVADAVVVADVAHRPGCRQGGGGAWARRIGAAEERRPSGARLGALRHPTRRVCLSAVSAANAASYATGQKAEHRRASAAQRRPAV